MLILSLLLCALVSCGKDPQEQGGKTGEVKDYVSLLTLDTTTDTLKTEATVKTFIDGDTTHFYIMGSDGPEVLKARYLAINTPESTGKIEEYGKAASRFTREKLESATSIILESESDGWDRDSTGGRFLVWVWYRTSENEPYRNLNLEILQNGLAIASSTANNRYGETCVAALNQAKSQKIGLYSGLKDPDFYYGDAVELTAKELRTNLEAYNGVKVAFEGVVTRGNDGSVYMEEYDPDTGLYFGMVVYCGYNLSGAGLSILSIGNRVRMVGTLQYWETGETYQISGISYRAMKPDDPSNIQKLGEGFSPAYAPIGADVMNGQTISLEVEEDGEPVLREYETAALLMNTTVSLRNLTVKSAYTTTDESIDSYGAMTLICESEDGLSVQIRTSPLHDETGALVTSDAFLNRRIDVQGLIGRYGNSYQIQIFSVNDITIND